MIPLIVALSVKYIYGDWDRGSEYSLSDFIVIIVISILTLKVLDSFTINCKNKNK